MVSKGDSYLESQGTSGKVSMEESSGLKKNRSARENSVPAPLSRPIYRRDSRTAPPASLLSVPGGEKEARSEKREGPFPTRGGLEWHLAHKELLPALVESIPGFFYYRDEKGIFRLCNRSFDELSGVPLQRQKGKREPVEEMEEPFRGDWEDDLQVLETSAGMRYERILHTRRREHSYIVFKLPLLDSQRNKLGMVTMGLDHAFLRWQERSPVRGKKNEDLTLDLAGLIDASSMGVLTMNQEGAIIDANDLARELFDIVEKRSSERKERHLEMEHISPEEFLDDVVPFFRCKVTGEPVLNRERNFRKRGGESLILDVSGFPLYANDSLEKIVFVVKNVTKERELQKQHDEQEKLLLEQSKLASLGKMIGVISHQLKQPLSTLSLLIQDLEEAHKNDELDKFYLQESVQNELNQIKFMSETIDNFMNFIKKEKTEVVFSLKESVEEIVFLILQQLKKSEIQLHIEVNNDRETPICVAGFPDEFKHVVLNLINNARESILERRKRSALSSGECGRIDILLSQKEEEIRVEVHDDGTGIPEDKMEKIFQPNYTTRGEGSGIGLHISRLILSRMKGEIKAGNLEQGACFTILFPGDSVSNLFREEEHCIRP